MNTQTLNQKQTPYETVSNRLQIIRWIGNHPAALSVLIAISVAFLLMSLMGTVNTGITVNTF